MWLIHRIKVILKPIFVSSRSAPECRAAQLKAGDVTANLRESYERGVGGLVANGRLLLSVLFDIVKSCQPRLTYPADLLLTVVMRRARRANYGDQPVPTRWNDSFTSSLGWGCGRLIPCGQGATSTPYNFLPTSLYLLSPAWDVHRCAWS